ncbi:helix-turn-helix transcriptional regulator [Mucilaginibacter sp. HC2]|uniref:helix-turn-helix domain-containing protein n=1 Tax=Mucilaginibacter gossypii TaxID=551996 RepID=UPI00140E06C8|nr:MULTISPECIES: helix-turn-helix transcriptional regulator [Mucilaginibacter]NHA05512.1 helix-turn-helix transcriptional regulator [Mucilaginibacter inviolabilis]QTE35320.1 helix-turn-helix transcriptional regulator [Mucilaginibacter gossypii]
MKNVRNQPLINALGQRVRILRTQKKLSMERLAELSEIDYRQVSYVELGQTDASISTLSALCKGLEITLAELMDAEGLK